MRRALARRCARALLLCAVALLAAGGAAGGAAASDPPGIEAALARARELRLAESPTWRALLHYRRLPLRSGWTSQADGIAFFAAVNGKRDPQAELDATLRALLAPGPDAPDVHPRCRFPARYAWLARELELPPSAPPACPAYAEFRAQVDPERATLIFAEAFLNNPASMFGHTLLRLDTREGRDLLGWAVNFAGATGNDGGFVYAARGLTGQYQGYFSVVPYYEKVKSYSDWENRDIWEYDLALTPEELALLVDHLWELQGIAFDYYYFDENCSQQLLALLEAARPALREREYVPPWVIPADTVRVAARQGLVTELRYRPSAATRLRYDAGRLPRAQRKLALRVASGDLEPESAEVAALSASERAALLDVAYQVLRYRYLGRELGREQSASRARRILLARSQQGVSGAPPEPPRPAVRPDQGHDTARVSLVGGARDGTPFIDARFRPAFHDLLDPQGGYVRGAQIDFFNVAVRVFPEDGRLRLQELVPLEMVSLTPWDSLFRPLSFRIETGLRTRLLPGRNDVNEEPVYRNAGGLGLAFDLAGVALAYALAEATLDLGPALDHDVALGAGGSAGVLITPGDRWRGQLFGRVTQFAAGDTTTAISAGLLQGVTLSHDLSLELRSSYERDFGRTGFLGSAGLRLYF